MSDPKFVRLVDRLALSSVADVGGSLWSISGADVLPFPDDEEEGAQAYVRRLLQQSALEEASQAEYDEAHPTVEDETPRVIMVQDRTPHQEAHVQRAAVAQRRRLMGARSAATSGAGEGSRYGSMKKEELQEEVRRRNTEYDANIPEDLKVAELRQALADHDQALVEAGSAS